ncbi:ABC transporter permease subunit [Haloglomus litoreum]|uniref:ABC transporter permease subunit n=1 Tax=Haloglomus litoreum TaxID=3034026 RepID=UPI0023E87E58|nr:ABC transporter permease subunit [Haloglomus sp. DT116]
MTWRHIARRDGALTARTRSTRLLLGALVTVVVLAGYLYPIAGTAPFTTARFPGFVIGALTTVVPFVGVLTSYGAVVGDRESGAIRLSLSLPLSRSDLVLGKTVGRAGLVVGALVGSLLLAGALVVYPFGELALARFLAFLVVAALFGLVWSGLGIAVSLAAATRRRALVLGFGLVFLFAIVWDAAAEALALGLEAAGIIDGQLPGPVQFALGLTPGRVFERVTVDLVVPGTGVEGPWYLGGWVALGLLVLWAAVPLGLAYRRFEGSDLA